MRARRIYLSVALAAALVACGGGGDGQSTMNEAQPPALDPTVSWPVKPLLGTWTGTLKPVNFADGCTQADRPQTLIISSLDGVSYTINATPALNQPTGGDGGVFPLDPPLAWSGEPKFATTAYVGLHGPVYWWSFAVVAPDQAEVIVDTEFTSYDGYVFVCATGSWEGVLTRSN